MSAKLNNVCSKTRNNLLSDRNGASVIFATDDFFAVAENLLKVEEPEWREGVYTSCGKWMDGWETRRRRKPGHDFCVLALSSNCLLSEVDLDTSYFTGNFAPAVSLQASQQLPDAFDAIARCPEMGSEALDEEVALVDSATKDWVTILETVALRAGYPETCHNVFPIKSASTWRYLRLNIYPDGGVARLRLYGKVIPTVPTQCSGEVDLAGFINGGECVSFSNAHYGHPSNLISLHRGRGMFDGWETARRLDRPHVLQEQPHGLLNHSGSEWCIFKLGLTGTITSITVDTNHFKGNYPDLVLVEAADRKGYELGLWTTVLPYSKVGPHTTHNFYVQNEKVFEYVKVTMQPDGGISRVRIHGYPQLL